MLARQKRIQSLKKLLAKPSRTARVAQTWQQQKALMGMVAIVKQPKAKDHGR